MTIKHHRPRIAVTAATAPFRCAAKSRDAFIAKKRRAATRAATRERDAITVYDVERHARYEITDLDASGVEVGDLASTATTDYAAAVVDLACFNRYVAKINAEYDRNEQARERFLPFAHLLHPSSAVAQRATNCTEYDNFTLTAVCFSIASAVAPENSELDYYRYMRAVLQCEMPIDRVPNVLHAPLAQIIHALGGGGTAAAVAAAAADVDMAAMIRNTFEVFRPMRTILRCFYDVYVPAYTSDWFVVLHRVTPMTNYEFISMLDSHDDLKHEALVFQREQAEKRANTINYTAYELLHTRHTTCARPCLRSTTTRSASAASSCGRPT